MAKVLVVDDEKNIRKTLEAIFKDKGHEVFCANTGEEALTLIIENKPDIIFLDVWLPGQDGLEILKKIKELKNNEVVIMMSGHGNIETAVKAVKIGAYTFLEKPLDFKTTLDTLSKAFNYRSEIISSSNKLPLLQSYDEEDKDGDKYKVIRDEQSPLHFNCINNLKKIKQKTIKKPGTIYGTGLHSGERTGLTIVPLSVNKGIRFENIGKTGFIPAMPIFLDKTNYATTIKKDQLLAQTIEHFMAVLNVYGITNLLIKISKEIPICDGSALKFCELIEDCGIEVQDEFISEIVIEEELAVKDDKDKDKYIKIEPYDGFSIEYTLVYPKPLGTIHYIYDNVAPVSFKREIAPARTFGFIDELNSLNDMGLIKGGSIGSFVLLDKSSGNILNTELRFEDEMSRHKILDILGDIYLLNRPLRGKITASKTGHESNGKLVKLIEEKYLLEKP